MILEYKLSAPSTDKSDVISKSVFSKRDRLYDVMKNFYMQSQNNGVYAENILRIVLDGVNLNHLFKNHPHVDIAIPSIARTVPGVTQPNEIISVKSSVTTNTNLNTLLRDTKSIKLESVFSYIVFASGNFELKYEKEHHPAKALYNLGFGLIKKSSKVASVEAVGDNKDYKAVLNTTLYYLLHKNKEEEKVNFINDIITISNGDPKVGYELTYGTYNSYRIGVLRRISYLDSPISLGAVYLSEDGDDLTCHIHKTNPIPLSRYWEEIVKLWLEKDTNDRSFFDYDATKYLDYAKVKKLYNIPTGENFPIEIKISIGGYQPKKTDYTGKSEREKVDIRKQRAENKTNKLYVATKFQYADFKGREKDVNDVFIKAIDLLEEDPTLITSFATFVNSKEGELTDTKVVESRIFRWSQFK